MNLKETDSSETDEDLICFYPQVRSDPSRTLLELQWRILSLLDVGFYFAVNLNSNHGSSRIRLYWA